MYETENGQKFSIDFVSTQGKTDINKTTGQVATLYKWKVLLNICHNTNPKEYVSFDYNIIFD